MGSIFSAPTIPAPPPPPPAPPPLPTPIDPGLRRVREESRKRAAAQGGRSGTIATSSQGLTDDAKKKKTLLGE